MKVSEFVEKYNKVNNSASKDAMLKSLNVKEYVPILEKISFVERTVNAANSEFDDDGKLIRYRLHSMNQHVLFTMGLIYIYTDFDSNDGNGKSIIDDYDLLYKNGLIEKIFEMIGEREMNECISLLSWYREDFIQNNMSTQAVIVDQFKRLSDLFNVLSSPIIDIAKSKVSDIDHDDVKAIVEWIKNGGNSEMMSK